MGKFLKTISIISIILAMSALIILAFNQNNEINDLKNQNEMLLTERIELEEEISKLIEEKNTIEQQRAFAEEKYSIAKAQILDLQFEKSSYEQQIQNLLDQIEELKNSQGPGNSYPELEDELLALQNQLAQVQAEIAERQAEIDDLNLIIQELSAQIEEKDAQIESLIAQLNSDSPIFRQVLDGTVTHITAADLAGLTEIRPYAFASCTNLVSIEIPDSVTVIGNDAFYNCSNLETVQINETSNLERIGYRAFNCSPLLKYIFIPKTVSLIEEYPWTKDVSDLVIEFAEPNIANLKVCRMGVDCAVKDLVLPEGTYEIGQTFLYASNVESLVIPSTVQVIGNSTLHYAERLKVVVIKSEYLTPDMFTGSKSITIHDALYVPDSKVEEYKASSNFSGVIDRIKPLSEYVG